MERKIGETFEYEGKKLQVVDKDGYGCDGCFFLSRECSLTRDVSGFCSNEYRTDKKRVIFVEAKDEQQQELNLCEILKDCPKGEKFWSPMLGAVVLYDIDNEKKRVYILLKTDNDIQMYINADATLTLGDVTSPEIMLYPSKEQRDWSKFTAPWYKKERFDPKTLKAFDKIVVRNIQSNTWRIEYFSHIDERCKPYPFYCLADNYAYCVPYNDDTKHLVGTTDEAPEYYRYWED